MPIRDIEQLADVESRLGEANCDEALIRVALARLHQLDKLASSTESQERRAQGITHRTQAHTGQSTQDGGDEPACSTRAATRS